MSPAGPKISAAERDQLLAAARAAMQQAYAPYSKFQVGAAVLTESGEVFTGCNVENASYGLTNCAERTAIFSAVARLGAKVRVRAVAVLNSHNVGCSPCGACRQVIHEFAPPEAEVFYQGPNGILASTVAELLPAGFNFPPAE